MSLTQIIGGVDYGGAADAVQVLNKMLSLSVDMRQI